MAPSIFEMSTSPLVAPYKATLPIIIFSSSLNLTLDWGYTTKLLPDNPLPK